MYVVNLVAVTTPIHTRSADSEVDIFTTFPSQDFSNLDAKSYFEGDKILGLVI